MLFLLWCRWTGPVDKTFEDIILENSTTTTETFLRKGLNELKNR